MVFLVVYDAVSAFVLVRALTFRRRVHVSQLPGEFALVACCGVGCLMVCFIVGFTAYTAAGIFFAFFCYVVEFPAFPALDDRGPFLEGS